MPPTNSKTKSSLSATTTTATLLSLWQQKQQIPFNTNRLTKKTANTTTATTKTTQVNCKYAKTETLAQIAASSCMDNKRNKPTANKRKQQFHSKLTALNCYNIKNNNNSNNNEHENSNSNKTNSSLIINIHRKTSKNSCKNTINRKQRRCCWSLSSYSYSSPAAAATAASTSWIFCLWLCIAISSLAFVQCIPSPSSSMQQPQKRGKCIFVRFFLYKTFVVYFFFFLGIFSLNIWPVTFCWKTNRVEKKK